MATNPQLEKALEAFESRPHAEKILVALLLAGVLIWGWWSLFAAPLKAELNVLQQQITSNESRLVSLQARQTVAEASSLEDPNRAARQQLEKLVAAQADARQQLETLTGSVISPLAMNRLLTDVLGMQKGLRLLSVENQPPQRLTGTLAGEGDLVYRHTLRLAFEGDYLSTLSYLVFVESLSGDLYWDSLTITPATWPMTSVQLEIHTLSLEEGFVGV